MIHANASPKNHNKFCVCKSIKIPGVSVGWLEEYFLLCGGQLDEYFIILLYKGDVVL